MDATRTFSLPQTRRRLGPLDGQFTIPPDFDAPVPEIEDLFEGLSDDLESP